MPHEPKKKHSKSAKRIRRGSIKVASVNLVVCGNCKAKTLSHMACRKCGFYQGKLIRAKQKVEVVKA